MYQLAYTYYLIYFLLMTGVSIYLIRLIFTRDYFVNDRSTPRVVLFVVLLLQIVVAASGDYWTYRMWYDRGVETEHYEPIWETIRTLIPWGFDVFKLILWGGCLLLFTIMCRWHKSELLIVFPLFALFYMNNYSYARATIGYMLILFAYYLIVRAKDVRNIRWLLLSIIVILLVLLGLQMHRTMPILLAILVLSLLLPPRKNIIIVLLFLFPVISIVFNTFLFPYLTSVFIVDEDTLRLVDYYLADERGVSVFIRLIIVNLPMLLLFFVSFVSIIKREKTATVRKIAFTAFLIVYFAFLFYTLRAGNGLALFYRTLNMAYPFMLMSVAYSMKYLKYPYNFTNMVIVYQALFTLQSMLRIVINPDSLYRQVYERYIIGL